MIQNAKLRIIYFDVLQTDLWLNNILSERLGKNDKGQILEDVAINDKFNEFGLSSKNQLKNLGSTLVYLVFILLLFALLGFLIILNILLPL